MAGLRNDCMRYGVGGYWRTLFGGVLISCIFFLHIPHPSSLPFIQVPPDGAFEAMMDRVAISSIQKFQTVNPHGNSIEFGTLQHII